MRKRKAWLALAALTVALASTAHALTMIALDVDQLTRYSDAVVIARVSAVERVGDQPGTPLTRVRAEVAETLKGALHGSVEVLSPGYPDAPAFASGERVVLFVTSRDGVNVLTGFHQGRFGILHDGVTLDRAIPVRGRTATARGLDDLRGLVRAAVAAEGGT